MQGPPPGMRAGPPPPWLQQQAPPPWTQQQPARPAPPWLQPQHLAAPPPPWGQQQQQQQVGLGAPPWLQPHQMGAGPPPWAQQHPRGPYGMAAPAPLARAAAPAPRKFQDEDNYWSVHEHIPPAESDNAAGQSEAKGEKEMDQDSGKRTPVRYFYNSKTKTSCWTRPPGCDISILSASVEPLSWECIRTRGGTKSDWYVVITDGGGRFFCNRKRGQSTWVLPDEVAALLRGEDVGAAGDGGQPGLGVYRAVENAAVRAEFALDSEAVGVLGVGDVIEVLEARENDAGIMRVRFEHGWTSLVARNGTTLLVKEGAEGASTASEASAAKDEPAPKLSENETKLAKIAAFKTMLEECGVPASGAWETELPKFVDDKRYLGLATMAERRGLFDSFVRSKAERERKDKVATRKQAIAGFRELLAELQEAGELQPSSTMASVAASKGLDSRFSALELKDRETLLSNALRELEPGERDRGRDRSRDRRSRRRSGSRSRSRSRDRATKHSRR